MEIKKVNKTIVVEFTTDEITEINDTLGDILRWLDSRSISAKGTAVSSIEFKLNKMEAMFEKIRKHLCNHYRSW